MLPYLYELTKLIMVILAVIGRLQVKRLKLA